MLISYFFERNERNAFTSTPQEVWGGTRDEAITKVRRRRPSL